MKHKGSLQELAHTQNIYEYYIVGILLIFHSVKQYYTPNTEDNFLWGSINDSMGGS